MLEGHHSFAPELATKNEGFKQEYFARLAKLEGKNYWFRARNHLIISALQDYFPEAKSFFEIGCGTGFVLSGVKRSCPDLFLHGSEIFSAGLKFAQKRLENVELFQMDARHIPFIDEFDVIGAFDVLEHIAEDERVLKEIYKALKPGGGVILTVPQHPFLWSPADELACHVRRYESLDLKQKLKSSGFSVKRMTSFVSLLFPLMVASRLWQKKKKGSVNELAEFQISGCVNTLLEKVLDFERSLIKLGLNFPVGGSLLAVAKKDPPAFKQ